MKREIATIQTREGVQYKVEHDVFIKYSTFYRTMVQQSNDEIFQLFTIGSKQFDYIYEFLQLHKKQQPKPVGKVTPGVKLSAIMEEQDAQLIQRIFAHQPQQVKSIIDAAFYLHMDELLRRLAAGMVASLDKKQTANLVNESKNSKLLNEAEVSEEIHNKINLILFKDNEIDEEEE